MIRKLLLTSLLSGVGLLILAVLFSAEAVTAASPSATFTVTSTIDAVDIAPGDGTCSAEIGIDLFGCTLRAAVMEANALAGADKIMLPAGVYGLTLTGSAENGSLTGDLDILSDIEINGINPYSTTIKAMTGLGDRVIHIPASGSGSLTISNLTVTGGRLPPAPACAPASSGGGGISNEGHRLVITNVHIIENKAHCGGGLFDDGMTTIKNSFFFSNTSTTNNGGAILQGGGTMVISTTLFRDNFAYASIDDPTPDPLVGNGGAIFNINAVMTIVYSAIEWNYAERGAGIANVGVLTMTNSAVIENMAGFKGGGLFNASSAALLNVTFSKNSADANAAAILTDIFFSPPPPPSRGGGGILTTIAFNTVASNTVTLAGAGTAAGIWNSPSTSTEVVASIIDSNFVGPTDVPTNCTAMALPTSFDYNIDSDGSCAFAGPHDLSGVSAMLAPLANNDAPLLPGSFFPPPAVPEGPYGPRTHALLAGSPAIDGVSSGGFREGESLFLICPPPVTDQRLAPRAFDGDDDTVDECDIGAYEFGAVPTVPTAVQLASDKAATGTTPVLLTLALMLGLLTLFLPRRKWFV